jgi:hypothetical protein
MHSSVALEAWCGVSSIIRIPKSRPRTIRCASASGGLILRSPFAFEQGVVGAAEVIHETEKTQALTRRQGYLSRRWLAGKGVREEGEYAEQRRAS